MPPAPHPADRGLNYRDVGATATGNTPTGFRAGFRAEQIGRGAADFAWASGQAMTWGIQRLSGMRIRDTPDGPLQEGYSVSLVVPIGPFGVSAPARVVYVVDEPRRKGFAYGTLHGHPESGEERFVVELRQDETVWIVISSFSRPSTWYWRLVSPVLRIQQEYYIRRYARALARRQR